MYDGEKKEDECTCLPAGKSAVDRFPGRGAFAEGVEDIPGLSSVRNNLVGRACTRGESTKFRTLSIGDWGKSNGENGEPTSNLFCFPCFSTKMKYTHTLLCLRDVSCFE